MVSQIRYDVNTFIHRNREGVHSLFRGEVSKSQFVLWLFWLGRFGHSFTAFPPLLSLPSNLLVPLSPFLTPNKALQGFQLPKQPTNTKIQSISKTLLWSSWIFKVTTSSGEGCLNTVRLFSLGGELFWSFFFFSLKISIENRTSFSTVWGERKCSTRFRTAKSYFCIDVLHQMGQWPRHQSQNRMSKLKTGFVVDQKAPIRERFNWYIHCLKMLKANLLKIEINRKIR